MRYTHYKCDAIFNGRRKHNIFFYSMEQVTHKHLDPTPIEHKLMRGPPQRGRREREREIFHSLCLVGKIKKVGAGKFVYLSFIW